MKFYSHYNINKQLKPIKDLFPKDLFNGEAKEEIDKTKKITATYWGWFNL